MALLITGDIRNPFFPELLNATRSDLEVAGFGTMIFNVKDHGKKGEEDYEGYIRQIRGRRLDGLIAMDFGAHQMHDALKSLDMPAVYIGDLPGSTVDSVRIDDYGGGQALGHYLASKGHKRVAHIAGPSQYAEAKARADGFECGLIEGGAFAGPELRFEGTYLPPSGAKAVDWLVETHQGNMPTAIYFANHQMATAGLARLFDLGISVPGDIAVAAFGDMETMNYIRPKLTRVGVAPADLAKRACCMLTERLNGKYDGEPRAEVLKCTMKKLDSA